MSQNSNTALAKSTCENVLAYKNRSQIHILPTLDVIYDYHNRNNHCVLLQYIKFGIRGKNSNDLQTPKCFETSQLTEMPYIDSTFAFVVYSRVINNIVAVHFFLHNKST